MNFIDISHFLAMKKHRFKGGFTTLELLIVIIVIGIITAIGSNYWMISAERAKVVEIEKSVRSLKDYIDVNGFNSVTKVRKVMPQTVVAGKILYEIVDIDIKDVKKTHHFLGDVPDFGVVFACNEPREVCMDTSYDKKIFNKDGGPMIIYAIGNQDQCALDEAVYRSNDVNGYLAKDLRTKPDSALNISQKTSRLTFTKNGKTYQTNYCIVPIFASVKLGS